MTNSIWKTPEENPDINKGFACYKSNLSLVENNRYLQTGAVKPDREWGYVKEIIAQADKAERLQKAAEILIEFITKLYLNGNITDEQLERYKNKLKKIKLEQESNN